MIDYQFWIPVIVSILAIVFTGYQHFVSNKQFLFDRRISVYRMYKILLNHQKEASCYVEKTSSELCVHYMLISALTNDSKLSLGVTGWNDRDDSLMKPKNHKAFLDMIEKLRDYGTESYFIFDKCGQKLCDYYNKYADLCFKTYQYSILMKEFENETLRLDVIEDKQKAFHDELNQIYVDLCKISDSIKISKLEKSISFIRRQQI